MLVPVFSLKLNLKIRPRLVTIGNYFGNYPALTCATSGGKVFIHTPHKVPDVSKYGSPNPGGEVSLLNINQKIFSLCAGHLNPSLDYDVLMIGTENNLLAYDVFRNTDLFYREISDGANAITIGNLGSIQNKLAIVGGNCSIQGFDFEGNDVFWTVTGDNVCSLALVDFNKDNLKELVVGSEDFDIRVFKEDEIIAEMNETEVVTCLHSMGDNKFAYALQNGTVGIYERTSRQWRIKSKSQAVTIHSFDINNDGVPELITGWNNGKVDVRNDRTGEVLFKDNFPSSVAGIVQGAYTQLGKEQMICCSVDGEVRGYNPLTSDTLSLGVSVTLEQETIRELTQKKQNLLMELKNYEDNIPNIIKLSPDEQNKITGSIIPTDTKVNSRLCLRPASEASPAQVLLMINTTNDTIIRAALVFAEGIFKGESHVIHPATDNPCSEVCMTIVQPKDTPVDLHMKVFVGYRNCMQFHVFEITHTIPRFVMYIRNEISSVEEPEGYVKFTVSERAQRVCIWMNQNFLLEQPLEPDNIINVAFISLRDNKPLVIIMDQSKQIVIKTDNMDIAGDIVQSLTSYLKIDELNVTAHFPSELKILNSLIEKVDSLNNLRQTLSTDIADHSNLIRSMVVHAEDSRLIGDYKSMKRGYTELFNLNQELLRDYKIRCDNHTELVASLKQVNMIIQKASKLRAGKYKTQVVTACRTAIKNNNIGALMKIITTGASS
ncbi:Bardet-Biedl syndrome 2 protein isoform X1 [Octopus bimaculoides]|uniref:Bardet-Biedl syndrome 2 protein homolog n=1 Tax=Octopus bimaculoides TaxID=37653 RepID=A0A0L8G7Q7_OCTBM|nr:Bardet-Biedl syndrome 2 protein isoform X1 [Octopus bimaculoides]XP_052823958.1 Bardet-Biedl syndrome 2 protein isoform X1 [Octopus bimaculoides]|eukprot:XP_014783640.1 PREDICTED: Bardet-Biedl syndrome 2 protein-like [Octopus bimaculoides]